MGKLFLMCGFLFIALSGCVVADEYAIPEPPPERVEVIGVAPFPDVVWVGGHWDWERRHHRYSWRDGYWRRHRR
jgi:hypothetical protein